MRRIPKPSDEHLAELDHLDSFSMSILRVGPIRGWSQVFPDAESVRLVFEAYRPELTVMMDRYDPRTRHGHEPGLRLWPQWVFELLPAAPRLSNCDSTTRTSPPSCYVPWLVQNEGESSVTYLNRRGLLKPGELEAIRRRHDYQQVVNYEKSHRANVMPKYWESLRTHWQATDESIRLIWSEA